MGPSADENEVVSPWLDGLNEASERSEVVHLCRSFDYGAQYFSLNQIGLLFASRWMGRDVEPDLNDIRNRHAI